jgi:hypothetical protein
MCQLFQACRLCFNMIGIRFRSAFYGLNEDFQRAAAECACAPHVGSFAEISAAEYRPWLEIIDSEIRSTFSADITA